MQLLFLIMKLQKLKPLFLVFFLSLFTFQARAEHITQCPASGSPQDAAWKYQLFTAYSLAFSGYESPCEIQCLGRKTCQTKCQQKRGLSSLKKKVSELHEKVMPPCQSLTLSCLEQCEPLGKDCLSSCKVHQELPQ